MRIGVFLPVCLFLLVGMLAAPNTARAEEEDPAEPTPDTPAGAADPITAVEATDQVLTALEAKDHKALVRLSKLTTPTPWVVADRLCHLGESAAAAAFARVTSGPERTALLAYVAKRRDAADGSKLREAVNRARKVKEQPQAVLDLLEPFDFQADVTSIRALRLIGEARQRRNRLRSAIEAYRQAATAAEAIGWLSSTSGSLRQATFIAERARDFRLAITLGTRRVELARKRESPAELAFALQTLTWHHRNLRQLERSHAYLAESLEVFPTLSTEDCAREGITPRNLDEGRILLLVQRARAHWDEAEEAEGAALCAEAAGEYKRLGLPARAAQTRAVLGEHLLFAGAPRPAAAALEQALEEYEALKRPTEIAWVAGNLSRTYVDLGRYDEAVGHADRAYEIAAAAKSDYHMAHMLRLRGIIQSRKGEYELALDLTRKAVKLFRKLAWKPDLAGALSDLGIVHWRLAQWDAAFAQFDEALRLQTELKNKRGMAATLTNLGLVHDSLSDYGAAISCHERALALHTESRSEPHMMRALNNLAVALGGEGRLAEAMDCVTRSLALSRKVGDRPLEAVALGTLAFQHSSLGEYQRALKLHSDALALKLEIGDARGATATRAGVGACLVMLDEFERAAEALTISRTESKARGDRRGEGAVLMTLGALEERRRQWAQARAYYEAAMRCFEEAGAIDHAGFSHYNTGTALTGLKDLDGAIASFQAALAIGKRTGNRALVVVSLGGLAKAYTYAGRDALAIRMSRDALAVVPEITGGLLQEQGASVRSRFSDLYRWGLTAAARADAQGDFLHFVESGRAAALLEALRGRAALQAWVVPAELQAQETAARKTEATAVMRHRSALERNELRTVRLRHAELEQAREGMRDVVEQIRRKAAAAADLVYPEPATVQELRAWIGMDEAFVLYAVLESEVAALVLTSATSRIVRLGPVTPIREAALLLADVDPDSDLAPAVAALRRLVIEPLGLARDVRLLISPDGFLCYVPFVLAAPEREIAYVPSATTYGHLMADRKLRGKDVLALGDPNYGTTSAGQAVSVRRSGSRLARLPATRREVQAVGSTVLLGPDASETRLRTVVARQRWRAVHLACHGLIDPDQPMLSSLALSADDQNDGHLTCLDVFRLKIPADLVVLSACDTAKGKVFKTEGIVGLTRAFMFAGAPRVICSLWKVDDEATQALMIKFYELWNPRVKPGDPERPKGAEGAGRKGLGAAAALKQAQGFIRGHDKWEHPYYWAAWSLWGLPD